VLPNLKTENGTLPSLNENLKTSPGGQNDRNQGFTTILAKVNEVTKPKL
jgi:hypothetical protein